MQSDTHGNAGGPSVAHHGGRNGILIGGKCEIAGKVCVCSANCF
ncbi:hypothetical protein CGRA01v4_13476 [Colletotrichum graminicola]|nr:hypothetical protein CGRA01v4_13476 [Colletotrichum graminicola]